MSNPFLKKVSNPRKALSDIVIKKEEKPKEETKKKKGRKRPEQVSILLSTEEYNKVLQISEDKEISMTKVIRLFLSDKGFFND